MSPRKRSAKRRSLRPGAGDGDLGFELRGGPHGDPCRACRVQEVGEFVGDAHRGDPLDGFHPDLTPCRSIYATPEAREIAWWQEREGHLAVFAKVRPGERPWGWWIFEARCTHKPRCELPEGWPWPTPEASRAWLEAHDELTDRERVLVGPEEDTDD